MHQVYANKTKQQQKENLQRNQEQRIFYLQGTEIRITEELSLETGQSKKEWSKKFKVLKYKRSPA